MDSKIYQITKLNGNNYFLWRLKIEMLLQREKVWCVIEEPTPETISEEWRSKDQCARATIGLTLEDKVLVTIANCKTAKQAWSHLQNTYEHKGLSSRLHLLKKLYGIQYNSYGNMEEYLNQIQEIIERLRAIGEEVKEHHLVAIVLCGLTEPFNSLITALEMKDGDSMKLDYVMERLRDEASRQENSKFNTQEQNVAMSTYHQQPRRKIICHQCGDAGHIRRNCPKFNSNFQMSERVNTSQHSCCTMESSQTGEKEDKCFHEAEWALNGYQNTHTPLPDQWLIDSGASRHMTPIKENLQQFSTLEKPIWIKIADGRTLKAIGMGKLTICCLNLEQSVVNLELSNVLYIPELDFQLLSVPDLCEKGYVVNFTRNTCTICLNGVICGTGKKYNKTYILNGKENDTSFEMKASPCVHVWHGRLGHRAVEGIKRLSKENKVNDLNISACNHSDFCSSCKLSSMRQISFVTTNKHVDKPFKLLVTDLCGPVTPVTMGGKQFLLTVTDDFSNFTQVYLLRNKSEAADNLINFIKEGQNKFGYLPEAIRSDEGGEFMGEKFKLFLKNHGIKHQTSVVHTPQQNGKAERKNLTLMNMTRSMLKSSGLPKSLWGEAVTTATYIINRVQHSSMNMTPYEGWHGSRPSLLHLRAFGCPAFAFVHKTQRKKLDDTAVQGYMVGYGINKKCFRVWIPGSHKILNTISVKFDEQLPLFAPRINPDSCGHDKSGSEVEWEIAEPYTDTISNEQSTVRRSSRSCKGIPAPKWTY